jgi:hypothetical protein
VTRLRKENGRNGSREKRRFGKRRRRKSGNVEPVKNRRGEIRRPQQRLNRRARRDISVKNTPLSLENARLNQDRFTYPQVFNILTVHLLFNRPIFKLRRLLSLKRLHLLVLAKLLNKAPMLLLHVLNRRV